MQLFVQTSDPVTCLKCSRPTNILAVLPPASYIGDERRVLFCRECEAPIRIGDELMARVDAMVGRLCRWIVDSEAHRVRTRLGGPKRGGRPPVAQGPKSVLLAFLRSGPAPMHAATAHLLTNARISSRRPRQAAYMAIYHAIRAGVVTKKGDMLRLT